MIDGFLGGERRTFKEGDIRLHWLLPRWIISIPESQLRDRSKKSYITIIIIIQVVMVVIVVVVVVVVVGNEKERERETLMNDLLRFYWEGEVI